MRFSIVAAFVAFASLGCAHEAPKVATTRLNSAKPRTAEIVTRGLYITPPPRLAQLPLEQWRPRYPEAARTLDAWRDAYPGAAERLAQWEIRHDNELDVLVDWAITHPYEAIGAFFAMRMAPAWGELRAIALDEEEGFEAFLDWVRLSRTAACELARHESSLDRVARLR